jgi:hypothetical protein
LFFNLYGPICMRLSGKDYEGGGDYKLISGAML